MQRRAWLCQTLTGATVPACSITVYVSGTTTKATIYSDQAGASALANPISAGTDGTYSYYAPNGRYTEVVTAPGFTFGAAQTQDFILNDPFTIPGVLVVATPSWINATDTCTNLASPVAGKTWCFDTTQRQVRVYDGTKFATAASSNSFVPSLTDFGAVGDDATDNTTAITRALASLTTTGDSGSVGGMLYVPPGAYRHSGTITWPNKDYVIFGASDLVSVFRYTGTATGNQINSDGSTFPNKFRDVAFTSINTNGTLFNIGGGGRVIFEDVRFRADSGNPILVRTSGNAAQATQQTTFRNVYVNCNANASIGIQLAGTALPGTAATNIFGGRINQCTAGAGVGLDVATSEGLQVYGTNIEGNVIGARLDGVRAVLLDGLWFESNTTADVQIKSTTIGTVGVEVRNSRWASSALPINVDVQTPGTVTRGVRIMHNAFTAAASTANVRIQSGVTDSIIAFNTFSNATEISDAGTRTLKVGNVNAANVLTPMQTASDAGLALFSTATASNAISATAKVQLNSTSAGATTTPLVLSNSGSAANNTAAAIEFILGSTTTEDSFGRITTIVTDATGATRSGSLRLAVLSNTNLTNVLTLGPGVQVGAPTGTDKGAGSINIAGDYYRNGTLIATMSLTNASGTVTNAPHIVQDTVTLSGGTAGVALAGAAAFTNATSYTCVADDDTAIAAVKIVQNGGNGFTVLGTGSDVVRFICIGS